MIATSTSVIAVGLGDLFVSSAEELVAYSLGSCVAICLWDPVTKVAAMAHVVLPTAPAGSPVAVRRSPQTSCPTAAKRMPSALPT